MAMSAPVLPVTSAKDIDTATARSQWRSLFEQWRVLQACVVADVAIIMQAANTGLTGGSTVRLG
ncbi:hypothetical protein IC63_16725 [Paracoccus sphaerophysae]|uniref:Uncharacterized protein n=1 Tax=Paracoccus sphaerophysae TaxID=690417 RepID=A0A099ET37_9RHOB|nr:hypothetical protein IC63_16725 [Paracoccus sphaerophysae]